MGLHKRQGKSFFDGEKVWKQYMSWGRAATYKKLNSWCVEQGMFNPETGTVSKLGPKWAMWRWAFRNPEEAYPSYKEWQMQYGLFPTFEDFCYDVYSLAKTMQTTLVNYKHQAQFKERYLANYQPPDQRKAFERIEEFPQPAKV